MDANDPPYEADLIRPGVGRHDWGPVAGRVLAYVLGIPMFVAAGMGVGGSTYDCPPDATDCDLGFFNVLAGGVVAVCIALVVVVIAEIAMAAVRASR
jgi:hypothetical protein